MTQQRTVPLRSACSNKFQTERLHHLQEECHLRNLKRRNVKHQISPHKKLNTHQEVVIATAKSANGSHHQSQLKKWTTGKSKRKLSNNSQLTKSSGVESTPSLTSSSRQTSHPMSKRKRKSLPLSKSNRAVASLSSKPQLTHLLRELHLKRELKQQQVV